METVWVLDDHGEKTVKGRRTVKNVTCTVFDVNNLIGHKKYLHDIE